jgi:hypothetical protein
MKTLTKALWPKAEYSVDESREITTVSHRCPSQGNYASHAQALTEAGASPIEVRKPEQLAA